MVQNRVKVTCFGLNSWASVTGWFNIVHETVDVVLVETHVVCKLNIVRELGGVVRCTMEVDPPHISDMVGVSWVVVDIPLRGLRSYGSWR